MCLQLDIKYGPSSINVPRTLNAVLAQAVPRPLSSDLAAFFEDKPPEDGEPTKSTAPPPTTRRFVLSPDSSRSDAENSSSDDSDDDRFSAYESPTADSNVDEGFEDDEDEDEDLSASEEEAKYAPSETDSDDSVLSTGYGGAQLLVDITPGVAANYTLPPDGRKFCIRGYDIDNVTLDDVTSKQDVEPRIGRSRRPSSTPSSRSANNHRAPRTTPRKRFHDPDSDSEPELPATAPRERSASVSWEPPLSTPRKKTRLERRAERVASMLEDNGSLEWGLDLEAGVEVARTFREGSILLPVSGRLQCGAGKGGKSAT
ncbi:hypothetical protein CspeluHIS016_0209030 [Cutaneotrichosporon spelunceum]|uniref:Uncharacterized protein n=1 Tax=Cutaneotrichosporon spelunceum TaxID=1672016 RepID=A0AAD3TS53_9TREE|nr:hypothetical protein CspeluHIS016_0209030 [Cutaneotrichosporon spelunceum]